MIRRAAVALTLIGILVAGVANEAMALRGRHRTRIVLKQAVQSGTDLVVAGDLQSRYRNCTKYRRVGLFLGDTQIETKLTDAYGNFTLKAPSGVPGTYTIYAYQEYAVGQCGHLCKIARLDVTL